MSGSAHLANEAAPIRDPIAAVIDFLLDKELLSRPQLDRGIRAADSENVRLDRALNQLGLVADDVLVDAWGSVSGLAPVDASDLPDSPPLLDQLPLEFLQSARCLPIELGESTLRVAVEDPLDEFSPLAIAAKTGLSVERCLISRRNLDAVLSRMAQKASDLDIGITSNDGLQGTDDAERLRDIASDAPIVRLVGSLIERAVDYGASDIHLTATIHGSKLRYRVDGILRESEPPPAGAHAATVSRIKILAGLDIAERRLPQDGRIRVGVRGREIDLRVATMPHAYGEGVVLRLLDRSSVPLDFAALGLAADNASALHTVLKNPHGMVLVTGPTGSGKTTTLYAALSALQSAERNIVTVEDPVEYHLDGTNQIQVSRRIGLDFANALRAVLRQDPDVIMVGEIRDRETAIVATQAALTGHLVLATVHTNTAAGALPRLIDMGVEPFLLASTLRGVLSQRLVRRLCSNCRKPADNGGELTGLLGRRHSIVSHFEAVGCSSCGGTGYRGRIAISEYLHLTAPVRDQLLSGADETSIASAAQRSGMRTLAQDGLRQVENGVTTLAEIYRATGDME